MSNHEKKKSDPELQKYTVFTVTDKYTKQENGFTFHNPVFHRENTQKDTHTKGVEAIWNKELKSKGKEKASFFRCWLIFYRRRLLTGVIAASVQASVTFFTSGFLLNLFIRYLESVKDDNWYGIGLVIAMAVAEIIRAGTFCFVLLHSAQTGIRFITGFQAIVYRKILKLPNLNGKTLAEVVNIFGADATRVYSISMYLPSVVILPIYMGVGGSYLYYLIGPWSFIATGIFILCYFIQGSLSKGLRIMRIKILQHTDKRIRKMTEILANMKLIKMYAWEESFLNTVVEIRKLERKYLLISAFLYSLSQASVHLTVLLASVLTIAAYKAYGNNISASLAFTVVGTITYLRRVIIVIPAATRSFGEARVSFARIKEILCQKEFEPHGNECQSIDNAVEMENAVFIWEDTKNSHMPTYDSIRINRSISNQLFHIDMTRFTVEKGKLIGVCGPVGSGKSSLMAAILARMPLMSGHVAVNGMIAYAAQQAWIFNDTVRENILFGKTYDKVKFQNTIYACSLEPDLAVLDYGDQTEIGERGVTLSGGQKQRVSLARAVYSDSDIYLLDDPLSAVDFHVGRHLFHKCIKTTLDGKTVILATHQLQYLQHCDEIVVLEEGNIIERGHHDELMTTNGYYKSMMDKYHNTTDDSKEEKFVTSSKSVDLHMKGITETTLDENNSSSGKHLDLSSKDRGKVTEQEDMSFGHVTVGTYKSYINAAGGVLVSFLVLLSFFLTFGSVVFSDWWLGIWIANVENVVSNVSNALQNYPFHQILNETTILSRTFNNNTSSASLPTANNETDVYFLVYVSSIAVVGILMLLNGYIGARVTINASVRLHNRVLRNVLNAPMAFFDANPLGRILNRFSKDMDEADASLPSRINELLQQLCLVILSFLTSAVILPWILFAMVPVVLLLYILKFISATSIRQLKRIENVTRSPLISNVNITAQSLSTIVPYQQQQAFINRSMKLINSTTTATFLFECCNWWVSVRLDLAVTVITIATALTLALTKGSIEPALAAVSLTMCIKVVGLMQLMVNSLNETEARFTSIERLHHYEKNIQKESNMRHIEPDDLWPSEGRIIFSKAELKYRNSMTPALKGASFNIYPKMKIGIAGRTGAGKSTIATALFRLVELSGGHIFIDGVDVSHVALRLLRSRLSTIPQDPVLFAGTLRYNLDPLGKYTDSALWESLECAHIKEKILQFDKGLDYMIEENGENFSVGERQLICLARAILRKNKILLLDEATASIDTHTDSLIQQTIKEEFSECTVLTIAHRISTVADSDLIIILDNGKIVEIGPPGDLMSDQNSCFSSLINAHNSKKLTT